MSRPASILLAALSILVSSLASATGTAMAQQTIPCDVGTPGGYSLVSAAPKYQPMPQQVVQIHSRVDGATIQIGLLRPKVPAGVRVPVIVDAGPYYHALNILDLRKCVAFLADNFVPQGYAVAVLPVRGTSNDGGCMDLMGPLERRDLNQAITWLGTQPWSSGSVGMIGVSYDGSTPWEVASFGNPHLKTIVPEEGVPSLFNLMFRGGTADWRGPGILSGIYYIQSVVFYAPGRSVHNTFEQTACPEYVVGEAASAYSTETGTNDPFGFWAHREYLRRILGRYRGSVFLSQGLEDWNVNAGTQFPLINDVGARGSYVKMLLGQWDHSAPDENAYPDNRSDWANILLRWFDRWLKGERVSLGPRVQVEDAQGKWRNETSWPPPGRATTYWLTPSGGLDPKASSRHGSAPLALDPVHLQEPSSGQSGMAVPPESVQGLCLQALCGAYRTPPFRTPYRISGIPQVRLSVIPAGPTGDVSVYLYAEGNSGLTRLDWGQVDLRFPTGGGQPQSVDPGQAMVLDFPLQPLDAVVPAGERLLMVVSEGNTSDRLPSVPPFPVVLHTGGKGSGLTVLQIEPNSSQFFTPQHLKEA
ncbi:MAG TPA: CocE/NonD family hydrolase [Actinomycetota bacterium]